MLKPNSLLEGIELENAEADFRSAERVEQYRISAQALYIPAGFRWSYLPLRAVLTAEESHRSVTAGKCVAVTEKRPTLLLKTESAEFPIPLEKAQSLQKLLAVIRKSKTV